MIKRSAYSIWWRLLAIGGLAVMVSTSASAQAPAPKPAAAPAATDWTRTVVITPEGGFMMGNPRARVHVIEYASFTCPACKAMHETGIKPLKATYVARGQVRYEFRNYVMNGPDMIASLVARCQGPQRFFAMADLFFTRQDQWVQGFSKITEADSKALQALPIDRALASMADKGGLVAFLRTRGIPKTTVDRCIANSAAFNQLGQMQKVAFEQLNVRATPSFIINGRLEESVRTWDALDGRLRTLVR
jgi:protein-disulfide isomerase